MAAIKYGTLGEHHDAWTRTLSKRHGKLPVKVSEGMQKAHDHMKQAGIKFVISSYQEMYPDGTIMEHVFIKVAVDDFDDRRELHKTIKDTCGLYNMPSGHACKYFLHDHESYGNMKQYDDVMTVIEFIF